MDWHRRSGFLALTCWMLVAASGCPRATPPGPPPVEPLRIAAASDLQMVLPEVADRFRASGGGEVVISFGSSGQLAAQVRAGAPFDLFLSANESFTRDLARDGSLLPESVRPYAIGQLVLVARTGLKAPLKALQDLTASEIKHVAIANPDYAPYGMAARQALRDQGLWEPLQPKIVLAETVRQALQFVETGNADAGLVSKATANVPGLIAIDLDPALHDPLVQTLGVTSLSAQPERADRLAQFLTVGDGRKLLLEHGFRLPSSDEPAHDR